MNSHKYHFFPFFFFSLSFLFRRKHRNCLTVYLTLYSLFLRGSSFSLLAWFALTVLFLVSFLAAFGGWVLLFSPFFLSFSFFLFGFTFMFMESSCVEFHDRMVRFIFFFSLAMELYLSQTFFFPQRKCLVVWCMGSIVSDKLCRGFCSHTPFFFFFTFFPSTIGYIYIDVIFAALGAFLLLLLIILEGAVCGLVLAGLGSIE